MIDLGFAVLEASAEPFAAVPTLIFRLRITEGTGERIHADPNDLPQWLPKVIDAIASNRFELIS